MRSGLTGSKPDMVKPGVAGSSTKSPASSVRGRVAVDSEATAALEHGAEARLAEGRVADTPATGAADALREHGARLKQRDDFRDSGNCWRARPIKWLDASTNRNMDSAL